MRLFIPPKPPAPKAQYLAPIFSRQKIAMRNAMLSGGHSWEATKEAIQEAYPDHEYEYLKKLDEETYAKVEG